LRITFLLTQSLESPSGLGRYWPLSKELVRLGHDVTILALHHNLAELGERRWSQEGVQVVYVGQMHVLKRGARKHYYGALGLLRVTAAATWHLSVAALRTPSDAYHLGKPHPMNGMAAWLASRLRGRPLYLDCDDYEAGSNRYSGRWQRRLVTFFEDGLPRTAAGITTNTHFSRDRLLALGVVPERITYVPNGVDRERFSGVDPVRVGQLKDRLGLAGRKVVAYVGSISLTSHGVDLLIDAFAKVHRSEPGAMLLMVGGGEDLDALQERVRRLELDADVRFAGRVQPAEVPLYYALADVTVDPVHDDPASRGRFPLKIVESLASGVPVVTGAVGDRHDLVQGRGGVTVEPGDVDALAAGILSVLTVPAVRTRLAAEAMEHREAYYWDRLARHFLRAYSLGAN
jgi:glycosyltransferase involved in cell wall biosynthesis